MKKIIFLLLFAIGAIILTSCKKCISCTDLNSQSTAHSCGYPRAVKNFEAGLKETGELFGQEWVCVDEK